MGECSVVPGACIVGNAGVGALKGSLYDTLFWFSYVSKPQP